ncbi:MAG: hypothetical protein RL637_1154 [Pseudomonadota bacterium]|jgi:hypothetical protein
MHSPTIAKIAWTLVLGSLLGLNGCSDEKSNFDPMDKSQIVAVTDMDKQKFEHQFADQCVDREIKNAADPNTLNKPELENTCLCISKYMMKDLTTPEAEKFLDEHENTESLRIRFDAAAYHCLQEKAPPHSSSVTQ